MIKILSFTQYKETYIDRQPNIHSDSDWDFFVALETNPKETNTKTETIDINPLDINPICNNPINIKPYIYDYLINATLVCFVLFMLF
jgi:hypothetical protein